MERFLMESLVMWKESPRRKPLILNGARQVGKTWILNEFGARHFTNVAYISFDNNPLLAQHFDERFDIDRLISVLQVESHERILPNDTLIIFDEIQECPQALTSLKYFCEQAPEYAVAAAGSLLGVMIHKGTGYPVGKVDTLNLFPLSFREFLDAVGEGMLRELVDTHDYAQIAPFGARLTGLLRQYYFVGGMPEAVEAFRTSGDFGIVRTIQERIVEGYERDMSKHLTVKDTESALAAWRSIPAHLGQENKRFIFGHIKSGARARDYSHAITWLVEAGLTLRVPRVSKPAIPLSAYADASIFKLFLLDIGLLGAISQLDAHSIIEGNSVFTEFKGALTEQYVAQQLVADMDVQPYYWSANNSRGEIDFLVHKGKDIYPIEVKAEENLRAKSLRAFTEKYDGVTPVRTSLSPYRRESWMYNIPLYALSLPTSEAE